MWYPIIIQKHFDRMLATKSKFKVEFESVISVDTLYW
jgi:hypothetical protein